MPETPMDLPNPDTLITEDTTDSAIHVLPPLHMVEPARNPLRTAREYLRDADIHKAMARSGYTKAISWALTNDRANKLMRSDRFQEALAQATSELVTMTLARVAVEEKGTAAVSAAKQLQESIAAVIPKPKPKAPKKKWSKDND